MKIKIIVKSKTKLKFTNIDLKINSLDKSISYKTSNNKIQKFEMNF